MDTYIAWDKELDEAIEPQRVPVDGEWSLKNGIKKSQYHEPILVPVVIRIITKLAFLARLKPYWADYRKAKNDEVNDAANGFNGTVADAVDYFLDQFSNIPVVDLDAADVVEGVQDLVLNIKKSAPGSGITSVILLADGTEEEKV